MTEFKIYPYSTSNFIPSSVYWTSGWVEPDDKPITENDTRTIIKEVLKELDTERRRDIQCEYCKTYNPIKQFRCDWCNAPLPRPEENIKTLKYTISEHQPVKILEHYDEVDYDTVGTPKIGLDALFYEGT